MSVDVWFLIGSVIGSAVFLIGCVTFSRRAQRHGDVRRVWIEPVRLDTRGQVIELRPGDRIIGTGSLGPSSVAYAFVERYGAHRPPSSHPMPLRPNPGISEKSPRKWGGPT